MGIEWVDRTQRTYQGNVLHQMGAGVDLGGRDQVEGPYAARYNGFVIFLLYLFYYIYIYIYIYIV